MRKACCSVAEAENLGQPDGQDTGGHAVTESDVRSCVFEAIYKVYVHR